MGKASRTEYGFTPISLLHKLASVYAEIVKKLVEAGATEIQIDEPALVLDAADQIGDDLIAAYKTIAQAAGKAKITVTTFFGSAEAILPALAQLPVHAIHVDLTERGKPEQLDAAISALKNTDLTLSLGLVSGRNVWKTDLAAASKAAKKAIDALGADRVVVATSSSLLHTPVTLANETKLSPQQKDWFSFATEKVSEVAVLAKAVSGQESSVSEALAANEKSIKARRDFEAQSDASVRDRLAKVTPDMYNRKSKFPERRAAQDKVYKLPPFSTTTIGSFPQTPAIRSARAKHNKGEISNKEYEDFIAKEIEHVVRFQETCGLDLLVHGEPERNDMCAPFFPGALGHVD